jgi:hypothetical protein
MSTNISKKSYYHNLQDGRIFYPKTGSTKLLENTHTSTPNCTIAMKTIILIQVSIYRLHSSESQSMACTAAQTLGS